MTKTFDPKVYELAAAFLSDEASINTIAAARSLAWVIQTTIEIEIALMRDEAEEYA